MLNRLFSSRAPSIGIDLGTANTRVVDPAGEILFDQPSLCCFKAYNAAPGFIAAGNEARSYQAKIAKPLKIINPLEHGVLSDMAAARELLNFARKTAGVRRSRVRPAIGVPADATQAEKRALIAAATDAGFSDPVLIAEPLLAARRLELPTLEPQGHLIVECGGGAIDVAVVSLGGMCVSRTMRAGGLSLDRAIIDHLHLKQRFQIGPRSAEQLKLDISKAFESDAPDTYVQVRGSDLTSGLPKPLTLPASEFRRLWMRFAMSIATLVREVLAGTAPELARDVLDGGIHLTGGAARTALIASAIARHVEVPVHTAREPQYAVTRGLADLLRS